MKRLIRVWSVVFLLFFLIGCSKKGVEEKTPELKEPEENISQEAEQEEPEGEAEEVLLKIEDYYPLKENVQYIYEGEGNEYAGYHQYVDFMKDNRIQIRSNNGGTEDVRVLEIKDGQLVELLRRSETYFRENLLEKAEAGGEVLLKEPLTTGTEWVLTDGSKRYISDTEASVLTPSGEYTGIEVTTENENGTRTDYYVKDMGLVKSVFKSEGMEVTSALKEIKEDIQWSQNLTIYYPNIDDDMLYYTEKELSFSTNDVTRTKIEEAVKETGKEKAAVMISDNVKIKSLYLNQDNIVYVDFTEEFITEMNAGSGYESMILQSIVNTLGTYYGVEEVYLTVEGKPYSSGHIELLEGETFRVNKENVRD